MSFWGWKGHQALTPDEAQACCNTENQDCADTVVTPGNRGANRGGGEAERFEVEGTPRARWARRGLSFGGRKEVVLIVAGNLGSSRKSWRRRLRQESGPRAQM